MGLFDGILGGGDGSRDGEAAPAKRRTIDGKEYRFKGAFGNKRSAKAEAQSERNKGNLAKVVKLPKHEREFGKWGVYRRSSSDFLFDPMR